jgi:hypothetical protein
MEPKKFKKLKNIEIIFINNVKQLKNVVVGWVLPPPPSPIVIYDNRVFEGSY